MTSGDRHRRRIGVIGHGAVGSVIAEQLARGLAGCELAGVHAHSPVPDDHRVPSFEELLATSDLVVEAASQEAVASYGPAVVEAGVDLMVVSVGALRDDAISSRLRSAPGRLLVTTGALGGVDQLRAATLGGGLDRVSLSTRKPPPALVEPWMDAGLVRRLQAGEEEIVVFDGVARQAVERFPTSVNVAATLALVTVGFDRVQVRLVADPATHHVEHLVEAVGPLGSWSFSIRNVASPDNPRTSAITPYAVLRALADLEAHTVIGV
jgi:aspartate dehydrogenase